MQQQEANRPDDQRVGEFQRQREQRGGPDTPLPPRLGLQRVTCRTVMRGETADGAVTGP